MIGKSVEALQLFADSSPAKVDLNQNEKASKNDTVLENKEGLNQKLHEAIVLVTEA